MKSREKNKVSHLFYMDDLKLFTRDETKLQQKMNNVKTFSNDIQNGVWPRQMCYSSFNAWQAN